jgi:hypothetical protein
MDNLDIQSIFFNKEKYDLKSSTEYLIKEKLGHFKRANEDRYYFRFTFQSRIKLQNQNYIKQIKFLENNSIKIEHYIKPKLNLEFIVNFK